MNDEIVDLDDAIKDDPIAAMRAFVAQYNAGEFASSEEYALALHRLCQIIDLRPCLHADGRLAVHLMNMSFSYDFPNEETLSSLVAQEIEMHTELDEPQGLSQLRELLTVNLRAVEAALSKHDWW